MKRAGIICGHVRPEGDARAGGVRSTPCNAQGAEAANNAASNPDLMAVKPTRYHHLKEYDTVKTALLNNEDLSSLIPRLAFTEEQISRLPGEAQTWVRGMRSWAVMQDDPMHNKLRRAFPTTFMVYGLTRAENAEFVRQDVNVLLDTIVQREANKKRGERSIDVMNDLARPLAIEVLCRVLGLKIATAEEKKRLAWWSEHMADTGERFPILETIECYALAVRFFDSVITRMEAAIERGDESEFDFSALIGKLLKEKKITDRTLIINQCNMWVMGGYHNPANLCGLSVGFLFTNPDQFVRLVTEGKAANSQQQVVSLLHQVTEEVMRMAPPAHAIVRVAKCPMDIQQNGKTIAVKEGDGLILHLETANKRMPNLKNPEELDLSRSCTGKGPKQLGFGHGVHRCMGGETGQLCAEILLEQLLFSGRPEFEKVTLGCFKWERMGSFKEIHDLRLHF